MWTPLIFTLLVSAACSLNPLSQEFIDHINSLNTTWRAGRNFGEDVTMADLRKLVGVHPDNHLHRLPERKDALVLPSYALPASFDSRQQWGNCASLNEIRDQGGCGSCWAFGAAESMTDRICIHSGGSVNFHFSVEDVLSCCSSCGYGCDGGFPGAAWNYWVNSGIVSGGGYGSYQGCRPYSIPPSGYEIFMCKKAGCKIDGVPTPACVRQCQSSYNVPYQQDLHYGSSAYSVSSNQDAIKTEIMTNGPVEAAYTVYEDFMSYRSGVYRHTSGGQVGGHAVKMMGWGTESGTPYWLIANSWNYNWGEGGYFKILRGSNECGIEGGIVAGMPRV